MSRQYFGDVLTEPIGASFTTITATTETVLLPTAFTPIPAGEMRPGKCYELTVGGTITTGTAGSFIITPRYGLVIGGTSLTASVAQQYVASITLAPFLYRCYLSCRSVGLPGANSVVHCTGKWESGGALGTASSQTSVQHTTASAGVSVDVSVASGLWIGVTVSVAPSIIPIWHCWRSLN